MTEALCEQCGQPMDADYCQNSYCAKRGIKVIPEIIEWAYRSDDDPNRYRLVALGASSALYRREDRIRALASGVWVIRTAAGEVSLGSQLKYRRRRGGPAYTWAAPPEGGRWSWLDATAQGDRWSAWEEA